MKKFLLIFLSFIFCLSFVGCKNNKPNATISTYLLDLTYEHENKCLIGEENLTYVNNYNDPLNELCFHLYANAFREGSKQNVVSLSNYTQAYPNGTSYGHIEIENVLLNDKNWEYEICGIDENILKISFDQPLYPNSTCNVKISFKVFLPNINHRFGYGENTVNFGNFYPIACVFENGEFMTKPYSSNGDPFYSQMSNYEVTIKYAEQLILASTGEVLSEEKEEGFKKTKILAKNVRDFAMVLSEKFEVLTKQVGNTKVMYYYYSDKQSQDSLETSCCALQTFTELIGEYPYSTLSVVEANFVHGGMEYPNLVYISDNLPSYEDYTNVIVHEIAHQWWYNLVGSNAFNNGWQDEGLTDYTTAMFYEKNPSYNVDKDKIIHNGIKSYAFFVDIYTSVYKELDTSMTRALDEYNTEPEYVYMAYVKSMLMFDSLRSLIGDKNFFSGLKLYFETYKFKEASPEQMIACFEKASKKELESFFKSWLEGKILIVTP